MSIVCVGASQEQKRDLDQSLQKIRECVAKKGSLIPDALYKQLNNMLDSKETHVEVEIKDDDVLRVEEGTQGHWAYWGSGTGRYIEINSRCFDWWAGEDGSKPDNPPRLTAVLLHELVHVAGGEELDAEFFENTLFGPKDGATLPTADDEKSFKERQYKGVFVSMDPNTREVSDLVSHKDLGKLDPASPINHELIPPNKEHKMTDGIHREELAKRHIATMEKRPKQMGVRVVVEFTGYLDKVRLDTFMNGIRTTLTEHLEGNGGGG